MIAPGFDRPLRIAVLAGGVSAEREISLQSGAGVAAALAAAGHYVSWIDPAELPVADVDWSALDATFVALHGGAGEDGRVQQELERLGVPFTGSSSECCRLAMSKSASKERFLEHGVPTPPYVLVQPHDATVDLARQLARFDDMLIVKPDGQGSSIGVAVVRSRDELPAAIARAREFDDTCLVEPFIRGREFTVAVLDDRVLSPIEIVTPETVFSYEAKYHSSLTEYRFDFQLAPAARNGLLRAALDAAKALDTAGLARVDLMLDAHAQAWVLEVNTVPGMTARSLAPQAAARAGIDMRTLCEGLVRRCLASAGAV